jgi:hypothetical protein
MVTLVDDRVIRDDRCVLGDAALANAAKKGSMSNASHHHLCVRIMISSPQNNPGTGKEQP